MHQRCSGWLQDRSAKGRGHEPFVEVSRDVALGLVAEELKRVTSKFGNEAIFDGSYGWSSAGRFHHAQSQVLNARDACPTYATGTRMVTNSSAAVG